MKKTLAYIAIWWREKGLWNSVPCNLSPKKYRLADNFSTTKKFSIESCVDFLKKFFDFYFSKFKFFWYWISRRIFCLDFWHFEFPPFDFVSGIGVSVMRRCVLKNEVYGKNWKLNAGSVIKRKIFWTIGQKERGAKYFDYQNK